MRNKTLKDNKERGVAILFAVLISVLMVSVAATIISIALRQTILSSTGRESQIAFYVANTALECAIYWDRNAPNDFADGYIFPSTNLDQGEFSGSESDVTCSNFEIILDEDSNWTQNGNITSFNLIITNDVSEVVSEEFCASVEVEKDYQSQSKQVITRMSVRGYNDPSCNSTSPRVVERGLEYSYTS